MLSQQCYTVYDEFEFADFPKKEKLSIIMVALVFCKSQIGSLRELTSQAEKKDFHPKKKLKLS